MNVSNLSNLFQQNSIFQQGRPLGQKLVRQPIADTLHRLSENLLIARNQSADWKRRFDTLELSAKSAVHDENSPLQNMPDGLLHLYLNQCKVGANLSQLQETSLMEYRDQLSAFDQTIQEYQEMLDGRTALPDHMDIEEVSFLLEKTKAARELFLQEGAKNLNRISKDAPMPKDFMGKAYPMFIDENEANCEDARWQLDASSKDIYKEIDCALASAHKATNTFQAGASSILAELKRRGSIQEGEEFSMEESAAAEAPGRSSLFSDIYHEIWDTLRYKPEEAEK